MDSRPSVAVLLGTDHHFFTRLVEWASVVAAEDGRHWFVQHGFTPWPGDLPANLTGRPMLGVSELGDLMEHADVVVTHGGPGLIMEARAAGHLPVVAPRDPVLGEHVDFHQLDFSARLAAEGTVRVVRTLDEFRAAVHEARRPGRPGSGTVGAATETVTRFAALVEQARVAPPVSAFRRRH